MLREVPKTASGVLPVRRHGLEPFLGVTARSLCEQCYSP
jgi:hypothetical protein